MIRNLKYIPYGQCRVFYTDSDNFKLVSYSTTVCEVVNGWLYVNGLYSATTRRHISAFMREYTPMDYYMAKRLFSDNLKINLRTGEVEKVA